MTTGKWFGPSGDCGCCGDRDPVTVCCPEIEACYPEGFINFSSVKAVVEFTDSFEFFERFDFPACSGGCVGQIRTQTYDYELSGLSLANGTYDGKFVQRVGLTTEWEETDPARLNICGSWFFPWVEIEVFERRTVTSDWSGGCFASTSTVTDGPTSVWFNPYLGQFSTNKTSITWPFLDFDLEHQFGPAHVIVLRCDPGEQNSTFTPYACIGGSVANFTRLWHVEDQARPVACASITAGTGSTNLRGIMDSNTIGTGITPDAGPIGFSSSSGLTSATCDGVDGIVVNSLCELGWQSLDRTIEAYFDTDTRNASCFPTVPDPLVNTMEWTEFNRKHSILLNA